MNEVAPSVLHLDHSSSAGGAELALLRILESNDTWQGSLLIPRDECAGLGVFASLSTRADIRVRKIGPPQNPGASRARTGPMSLIVFAARALGQSWAIRFSSDFRKADIVHANTSRAAVYGAVACWGTSKRFVIHVRDLVDKPSLGTIGFQLFVRIALRRANGLIGNSTSSLESAAGHVKPGLPKVVIMSAIGNMNARSLRDDHGAVQKIGMISRIDRWKGHDLLLAAFSREFAGAPVRLQLAGGAPFGNEDYRRELQEMSRSLGIDEQVDFLGHVDDIGALIQSWDICVQSSTRPEPLGQNVLQYLAAGKPVIAGDAGGPAEWITNEENGLLFEIGNLDSLATGLRKLVDDESLRTRLSNAASTTPGLLTDAEVAHLHGQFFKTLERRQTTPRKPRAEAC